MSIPVYNSLNDYFVGDWYDAPTLNVDIQNLPSYTPTPADLTVGSPVGKGNSLDPTNYRYIITPNNILEFLVEDYGTDITTHQVTADGSFQIRDIDFTYIDAKNYTELAESVFFFYDGGSSLVLSDPFSLKFNIIDVNNGFTLVSKTATISLPSAYEFFDKTNYHKISFGKINNEYYLVLSGIIDAGNTTHTSQYTGIFKSADLTNFTLVGAFPDGNGDNTKAVIGGGYIHFGGSGENYTYNVSTGTLTTNSGSKSTNITYFITKTGRFNQHVEFNPYQNQFYLGSVTYPNDPLRFDTYIETLTADGAIYVEKFYDGTSDADLPDYVKHQQPVLTNHNTQKTGIRFKNKNEDTNSAFATILNYADLTYIAPQNTPVLEGVIYKENVTEFFQSMRVTYSSDFLYGSAQVVFFVDYRGKDVWSPYSGSNRAFKRGNDVIIDVIYPISTPQTLPLLKGKIVNVESGQVFENEILLNLNTGASRLHKKIMEDFILPADTLANTLANLVKKCGYTDEDLILPETSPTVKEAPYLKESYIDEHIMDVLSHFKDWGFYVNQAGKFVLKKIDPAVVKCNIEISEIEEISWRESEEFFNVINVVAEHRSIEGLTVQARDEASIDEWGEIETTINTEMFDTPEELQAYANTLLTQYKQAVHFETIKTPYIRADIEIYDVITITEPYILGQTDTQKFVVQGIEYVYESEEWSTVLHLKSIVL